MIPTSFISTLNTESAKALTRFLLSTSFQEGDKGYGRIVTRDRPFFFFFLKCKMADFFLLNRDFP